MSKIKILSEHLANQIAAGEVIERPASVVKELLENSIDADARRVSIEVAGSGTKLIRVIDDGTGMDGDDVLLCLERHATSKLAESTDDSNRLAAIRSLGFRGEAMPSIASVARMSITSRTENDALGTRIEVRYGKVLKVHETGCNKGTVIEIKDLFGNVPARKKFLKSGRTELFHIEEVIKSYSLAYWRLGLTYTVDNRRIHDFSAGPDSLEDRVRSIFMGNGPGPLISLEFTGGAANVDDGFGVDGFLLPPEQSFAATAKLRLFVNGRAVKDRMMAHAVNEGLAGYLMKGRTAAGAVFVTVPHGEVDVNVHPTKQEIRFQQPNRIHAKIVATVRSSMATYQQSAKLELFGANLEKDEGRQQQRFPAKKPRTKSQDVDLFWKPSPETSPARNLLSDHGADTASPESRRTPFSSPENLKNIATAEPAAPFSQATDANTMVPETLEPIGQFMDLYLLCQARRANETHLVVIDQHAVHERVLFENLKKQFAAGEMASQKLLFPKMLELTPEYTAVLESNMEQVQQLGLDVEEFGGSTFILKAVPAAISHLDPEEILTGILMEFSRPEYGQDKGSKQADATRLDDILASMACKAAVKAGQNLSSVEIQELLKLMQKSKAFTHCPHGRPVVRMFSPADIKKWFHRT
ncbi:MAG: DNA mismatch repair endonuclease MutL [Desulfobulbales bacterium]|nr:DNA mismatch repair endonuclease MutL [Desulfobulbales bacterium]